MSSCASAFVYACCLFMPSQGRHAQPVWRPLARPWGEDGGDGLVGAGRLEMRTSRPKLGLPSRVYGYCVAAVLSCLVLLSVLFLVCGAVMATPQVLGG